MKTGALSKPKRIADVHLSVGEYEAVWSGYEIRILGTDWNITIATENGVRGRVSGRVVVADSGGIAFLPNVVMSDAPSGSVTRDK